MGKEHVMKSYLMTIAALLGTLSVCVAPTPCADRMDANGTLALVDRNKDGRIDREEYHQRMTEVFFFADVDKDGIVTFTELVAVTAVDPEAVKKADRDGDGKLSLYEFLYIVHLDFDAADKDQDGVLNVEEVRAMIGK
jgi:Ca2+-binding EF-hand superfamily protein